MREHHVPYLLNSLEGLSAGFQALDASKPWLIYWILHSLELLDAMPDESVLDRVVDTLNTCQDPNGGYGGGYYQLAHLAPTYAAVSALMIVGTKKAYNSINRKGLYNYLMRLRCKNSGFLMHENGEEDVRGAYCALAVASHLNMLTPELTEGVSDWILKCQNWEGGIGGEPFNEAHGGYAYCGLAALSILGKQHLIDVNHFLHWAVNRQMSLEGGFQGRTNKLVDGCYSFWQGGVYPILNDILKQKNASLPKDDPEGGWLFNQIALQEYILLCCQGTNGGLRDKPGKTRDFYHTCYCLSGLSIAQHNPILFNPSTTVLGPSSNLLKPTHCLYNIGIDKVASAKEFFSKCGIK
eukprot:TRINITY_DN11856_c0_g1_i1.p1 TRINITY_DN11856_c0_g1~~TRINITY_DN11856_c0_g1_i1.p1  ORF type:complete len:352 (-),score=62.13 TRINITY_DN11856_c0_g1_i1:9-1064(-)